MESNLHLFTKVEDGLPDNNSKVLFISTSKDGKTYEGFGTFVEKDQWQRENVFIGDGYHFIDGELQLPARHWNVTHWLDLSKLTTKEQAKKQLIEMCHESGLSHRDEITDEIDKYENEL